MSTDSIDEKLRKAFEASWRDGRPEPIERFLPPQDTPAYLPTLEELVHIELEFTWKAWQRVRHDADTMAPADTPTHSTNGPTRVEDYLDRFPTLERPEIVLRLIQQEHLVRVRWGDLPAAGEYHERFPDLVPRDWHPVTLAMGPSGMATPVGAAAETVRQDDQKFEAPELPRTFGKYELLAEIGHGGMGVVYQARQLGADRLVALKVVRGDYLQSLERDSQADALERFHHEIQAAARLHHENIVPVYEVGDVDGDPFFSMRYVEGSSLAQVLRDGPVSDKQGARYMVQVTRAIDEAHRNDVLHRDLKPQNIFIDVHSDRALVADFGLAKLLTSNEELTLAGEYLGSPPYMSPEQAQDASTVTTQTDVYALGATLYHVLCGRPPFQSAMPLVTLHQVMHQEPAPPRQLNSDIDRDLETICLKCLEKDPARRYESAGVLADELDRYLRGEPILARPIGTAGRTVRWCRRNPLMASLIAVSLAFLVLALAATSIGYVLTTAALREVVISEGMARATINDFYTNMSEQTLRNREGMQPQRRELLEKARGYYQRFVDQRHDDLSLQHDLAVMHFRIGRITHLVDSPDDALPEYYRALAIQLRLVASKPDDDDTWEALGDTHNGMGAAHVELEQWDEAAHSYQRAEKIRKKLAADHPDQVELQRKLASIYMNLGVVAKETGNLKQAREHFQQAGKIRRGILAADPQNIDVRRDLAMGCYNLANLDLQLQPAEIDSAETHLIESIERFEQLLEEVPGDLENEYLRTLAYRRLGDVQWMAEDLDAAGSTYALAIEQIGTLANRNPDVPKFRSALARLHENMGLFLSQLGDMDGARKSFRIALSEFERLAKDHPEVPDYERDLAATHREIALLHADAGEEQPARESLRNAQRLLLNLVERYPDSTEYTQLLEEVELDLATLAPPPT